MKIGIFKFSVRRYVMACTLIVTAKIAILLNPLVTRFWYWIVPTDELYENADAEDMIFCWFFTIASIMAVCAAIYAYNRATAWLFGESK